MRISAIVGLFLLSCTTSPLDDETAAMVNGEPIRADDVYYSIHFFPQYAASQRGRQLVDAHLELLITKKLFAQEGRRWGYDQSPRVQQIVDWALKDQMVRALYREEIRNKTTVSDEEIKEAFFKGREQVRLRHIFVRSETEALNIKLQLDRGVPFEQIAAQTFHDSTLAANGGDLGFVSYSDIDEKLAEVAFDLPEGVTSAPVRSRWGYHILRVDQKRRQVFNTYSEFISKRQTIAEEVRRRKEKKAAGAFVSNYMARFDVKMMNPTFALLAEEIKGMIVNDQAVLPKYRPMIGNAEIERLQQSLSPHGQEVLITFKGGQWTLGDFLERLGAMPLSDRPRIDTPANLRYDIGVMVMREFLAQEAKKRGLDKDAGVRSAVQRWRDEYTFSEFWQTICDTIAVGESDLQRFFAAHPGRYREEEKVAVREILVETLEEAQQLLQQIAAGADFATLARTHSKRPGAAEKDGALGLLKRFDYGNISIKAFELQPGQVGGPITTSAGFSIIKNEGYFASRPATYAEAHAQVMIDARRDKEDRLYQKLKETLKQKAVIQINEKLLAKIAAELPAAERVQMMKLPEP